MAEKHVIMIVEDDPGLREALTDTLELSGYSVVTADCAESALSMMSKVEPNIVVSDVNMPGLSGHDLLTTMRAQHTQVPVLLMTAFGNVTNAVKAMRDGAVDYLPKPFEPKVLIAKIQKFVSSRVTKSVEPIAEDPNSRDLLQMALKVSATDATVMIGGESGTGKEVLARYIHDHSDRAGSPFVAINCAAIPENMLEATLFGYEKGAFTGAHQACPGKFEQAQNGTLLLDEISEMDLGLQAKLLRVLQEKEVERLGGRKTISLNVRVLATSNRDMEETVREGKFREDLYYRLNVFPLNWYPLRERPLDIMPLANYLLARHAGGTQRGIPSLSEDAARALTAYDWPGNAREMENVIQRSLIISQGDVITSEDLALEIKQTKKNKKTDVMEQPGTETAVKKKSSTQSKQKKKVAEAPKSKEFQTILDTLKKVAFNRKEAAEKLGISARTLRYKIAKMRDAGIEV